MYKKKYKYRPRRNVFSLKCVVSAQLASPNEIEKNKENNDF